MLELDEAGNDAAATAFTWRFFMLCGPQGDPSREFAGFVPEDASPISCLTVPVGAETCGPFLTPDAQTLLCAVQHPGEREWATFDDPASTWPDRTLETPRPAVVSMWRAAPGDKHIGA